MNHLKVLVEQGFIIEEDSKNFIENMNDEDFQKFVDKIKKDKTFIISKDLINKTLTEEIEIIKQFKPKKSFTVQNLVKKLNEKYNFLQNILLKKIELKNIVSINKASIGTVSIIGIVNDIIEKNNNMLVVLEDPTGSIETVISKKLAEKIALDDVIAVSGNINNKILFVDKVLFPSIRFRKVNYSSENIRICFSSGKMIEKTEYIIQKDSITDNIKNKKHKINPPCFLNIKNIIILVSFGYDPIDLLNKRYVNIDNNVFIIDTIPDIIFTDSKKDMNYKGISIVSLDKIINLKTRQVTDITV